LESMKQAARQVARELASSQGTGHFRFALTEFYAASALSMASL